VPELAGSVAPRGPRGPRSLRNAGLLLTSLAVCRLLLQFAGINHYGYFRDELYYIACGEHLAWGYVDQPPLIALIAWLARHLLGTSLFATRLFPALAGSAIVYCTGRLARELGGGAFAEFLAALAILLAPAYLAFDSFLSMNAFEPLIWLLCAWIAIRIVKGAAGPRWWLAFGALAGVGLQNKHTMLVFGFALVAGLIISGQARLLASPWLWLGGALAFMIFLPNLVWEARHGWPQIEVVRNGEQYKILHISGLQFVFEQVLFLQPLALPVWLAGLGWFFWGIGGRRFRFLGWAYLIVMVIFIGFHGKSYYALPIYPVLLAAGGVALGNYFASAHRRWLAVSYATLLVIVGLVTLPFGVPLLSVRTFIKYSNLLPYARSVRTERDAPTELPQLYADMFGWDTMARQVARVYHSLPSSEQQGCAILAGNYGEAGAIDLYGPAWGLPKAISGHNSYFYWGPRNYTGECAIVFGERADEFKTFFAESHFVTTITNTYSAVAERDVHVYVCRKPVEPLSALWPRFKMII
jgi:hypothetical protein